MTIQTYVNEILNATHCETIKAVINISLNDMSISRDDFKNIILDAATKKENEIIDKILEARDGIE